MMQQQISQEPAMSQQQQQQLQHQQLQQQQIQQQQMQQQQQQLAQQMVLCPVRVVYETQILMPPGEQVQPHQTYFVNPQNQPPWATQNTAMFPQNQMLYVQQMQQNNIVPTGQPNMDQNQMFIQQTYPTMQQMVANQNMQVLAQNMQDRQVLRQPVQFANVPGTMNVINMNQYGQMIGMQQMANMAPNIVQPQNIQMIQNPATPSKPPDVQQNFNIIRSPMTQTNIRPNVNVTPQHNNMVPRNMQQQNVINLQQNVAGNSIQVQPMNQNTVVQNIQQNAPSLPQPQPTRAPVQNNVRQTFVPNVTQNTSQQTQAQKQNVGSQQTMNVQRSLPNVFTQQNQNVYIRQSVPMEVANSPSFIPAPATSYVLNTGTQNKATSNLKVGIPNTVTNNNTQHGNVQIRPRAVIPTQTTQMKVVPRAQSHQQVRSIPQLKPMGMQTSLMQMQNMSSIYPNMQSATATSPMNVINQGMATNIQGNNQNMATNIQGNNKTNVSRNVQTASVSTETVGIRNSTGMVENRKRKSESPDEFRNKVSVNTATQVTFSSNKNVNNSKINDIKRNTVNDVGVNTISAQRLNVNVPTSIAHPENKTIMPTSINPMASMNTQNTNKTELQNPPSVQENISDKLIRNTVFAQARVRKISNSSSDTKNSEIVTEQRTEKVEKKVELNVNQIKKEEVVMPVTQTNEKSKEEPKEIKPELEEKIKDPVKIAEPNVKQEPLEEKKVEVKEETKVPVKTNSESILMNDRLQQMIDFKGKEIELFHGNIHKRDGKDNNYILTHVLDGIVIQESNVAFPIRLPLKEKMLPPNTSIVAPTVQKTETKLEEDKKDIETKLETTKAGDSKILTISELNLDGKKEDGKDCDNKSIDEDNPFHCSKPQTIKSWSAEELAKCLAERGWCETASILREHEIDGEALFLVSSAQLLEIGINENHASSLCNFVKS